jgi:uncharacterized metal-binding protein YceD (DUF177 family)
MSHALVIPLEALEQGPYRLEGSLPGEFLGLQDEVSIRNIGDISYHLTAERLNQEVLVRGSVEAPMELECGRSGLFFSTMVRESAFLRDYSLGDVEGALDIADDVREAIVIEIPSYPVSPEAQSEDFCLPKLPGEWIDDDEPEEGPNVWKDLDKFKPNN